SPRALRRRSRSGSLDGAGEEPFGEVALEREEHGERDDHRQEGRRRDQVDVRSELPQLGEDRDGHRLRVPRQGQRDEQVVPRPEELEDRERRDRRQAEREDQTQEDPRFRRAVDARRFEDVLRNADEEVPEQEDRERQRERGVEEDERDHRVEDPQVVEERKDRDQRHLKRYNEQPEDDNEEPVAAGEVDPRERVGRARRDDDRQDRAADRDLRRRDERVRDVRVVPEVAVVLERREAGLREDLPPAVRDEVAGREQRREEQADRRHEPREPDDDQEDVQRPVREGPGDPRRRRLRFRLFGCDR